MQHRITWALGSMIVGVAAVAFYVNDYRAVGVVLGAIAAVGIVYSRKGKGPR